MSHHLPQHVDMLGNVLSELFLAWPGFAALAPSRHTHTLILCMYAQLILGEFSYWNYKQKELHFGLGKLMEGSGWGWREKKEASESCLILSELEASALGQNMEACLF